jgi:hypothetical protein
VRFFRAAGGARACGRRAELRASADVQFRLRAAGCGLRAAGCGLRAAGCGLRAAGCGLRAAGCGLRSAVSCGGVSLGIVFIAGRTVTASHGLCNPGRAWDYYVLVNLAP